MAHARDTTIDRHDSVRRWRGVALAMSTIVAVVVVGAWSYLYGPFDADWRLERQARSNLSQWEAAGPDLSSVPAAVAAPGRATTTTEIIGDTDATQLTVGLFAGVCDTYLAEAVESQHAVGVIVLVRSAGGTCPSIAVYSTTTLQLEEPLRQRVIYNAQTGEAMPVVPGSPNRLTEAG